MKRVLISLVVIFAMLSIQGCNKTWAQYFDSSDDLNGWEQQALFEPYSSYVTADGLYIDGSVVHAPFGFEGDFTLEIAFDLHVVTDDLPLLQIVLADGKDAIFSDYVASDLSNLGNLISEFYVNYEAKPYSPLSNGAPVPGLDYDGRNIYKFIKTGDHIRIYIGDSLICDKDLASYPSSKFFPSIFVNADSQSQIAIKSIKVIYATETIVHPRP